MDDSQSYSSKRFLSASDTIVKLENLFSLEVGVSQGPAGFSRRTAPKFDVVTLIYTVLSRWESIAQPFHDSFNTKA